MPARRIVLPDALPTPTEQRASTLDIRFARGRTRSANSFLSLQAAEFASQYGDEWRFYRRMFKAYFEDLEDIGDLETVVRVGAEAGLDAGSLHQALTDGRHRQAVDDGVAWSRGIGVTAIPTFVFNERYGMVGAQELDAFRKMMNIIKETPNADPST